MPTESEQFPEADALFKRLDVELFENIEQQYFYEPKEFRSMIEVVEILGEKVDEGADRSRSMMDILRDQNPKYGKLQRQKKIVDDIIEDVVKFQHGGLNNSVDTMSEVIKEYNRGRDDIRNLRFALAETKAVLTAKKTGQISMKDLWLRKKELEETLRILLQLQSLKEAPTLIQKMIQSKRYLNAVKSLNKAIALMFSEDFVNVEGIVGIRDLLMGLKESSLENIINDLRNDILDLGNSLRDEDSDDEDNEKRSEMNSFEESQSNRMSLHLNRASMNMNNGINNNGITNNGIETLPIFELRTIDEQTETQYYESLTRRNNNSSTNNNNNNNNNSNNSNNNSNIINNNENNNNNISNKNNNNNNNNNNTSLFVRFMIKAVGELNSEDDVERLLLESISSQFHEVIHGIREHCNDRFKRVLMNSHGSNNNIHGDFDALVAKHFTYFVNLLLKSSVFTLKRMLYVMKLLNFSLHLRVNGDRQEFVYTVKDHIQKAVLSMWSEIESEIINQLKIHFVEKEIENISDQKTTNNSSNLGGNSGNDGSGGSNYNIGALDIDAEFDDSQDNHPIFPSSVRLAAPIYRSILEFSENIREILRELNSNVKRMQGNGSNSSNNNNRPMTIMETLNAQNPNIDDNFECSVLKMIQSVLESELVPIVQSTVNQDMRDIQLNSQYFSMISTNNSNNNNSNNSNNIIAINNNNNINKSLNNSNNNGSNSTNNNNNNNNNTTNNNTNNNTTNNNSIININMNLNISMNSHEGVPISLAGQICLRASQPLFLYWLQLPQQSDMVVTILDRLLRGFCSSAREELEAISWKLLSFDESYRKPVNVLMQKMSVFREYRCALYGSNDCEVESLFNNNNNSDYNNYNNYNNNSNNNNNNNVETTASIAKLLHDLNKWSEFWNVSSAMYPVTSDKISRDASVVTNICAIVTASEWLVSSLSKLCNQIIYQFNSLTLNQRNNNNNNSNNNSRIYSKSTRMDSMAIQSSNNNANSFHDPRWLLLTTVMSCLKELTKLSNDGISLLLTEFQMISFHYLHQIAHIKSANINNTNSINLSSNTNINSISNNNNNNINNNINNINNITNNNNGKDLFQEAETSVMAWCQHLSMLLDAMRPSLPCSMYPVTLSTIPVLVPRILMKCIIQILINRINFMSLESNNTMNKSSHDKSRLLKIVVACQQCMSLVLESAKMEMNSFEKLHNMEIIEFDRLRRFVSMMDLSIEELKSYITQNSKEYSQSEFSVLWSYIQRRSNRNVSFEEFWNSIATENKGK